MSAITEEASQRAAALVARRWQRVDPLLPAPAGMLAVGAGHLVVVAAGGERVASGACRHSTPAPESLDLTWGAAHRFELAVQIGGPDIATPLDLLLSQWREHLDGVPGTNDADSAAVITWPSRDIGGVKTLVSRGFAPLAVIAARPTRYGSGSAAIERNDDTVQMPSDVSIRRARPGDTEELVRLGLEVIRFDGQVSAVIERPGTAAALRRELGQLAAGPESWVWLAERRGRAIGMLVAERPETARWIAPLVSAAPVAYLLLMGVAADQRGAGIGAAMVARLHREVEVSGVAVTLLHYAQVNPLSAPFWSQQGYRPLWTVWEATPTWAFR
jgi:GNAT superfamily N-acetyltransferase